MIVYARMSITCMYWWETMMNNIIFKWLNDLMTSNDKSLVIFETEIMFYQNFGSKLHHVEFVWPQVTHPLLKDNSSKILEICGCLWRAYLYYLALNRGLKQSSRSRPRELISRVPNRSQFWSSKVWIPNWSIWDRPSLETNIFWNIKSVKKLFNVVIQPFKWFLLSFNLILMIQIKV